MDDMTPPSKERGEVYRDVADMIRGMLIVGVYKMTDLPAFFERQADANDLLLERNNSMN